MLTFTARCVRLVVASKFSLEVEKCDQDLHNHLKYNP